MSQNYSMDISMNTLFLTLEISFIFQVQLPIQYKELAQMFDFIAEQWPII